MCQKQEDYLQDPDKAPDARWIHRPVYDWEQAELPRATANAARVMDPVLLETLNASPRSTGYSAPAAGEPLAVNFSAGGWVEDLVINGRCYQVHRADPLEPLSRDIWYSHACP